MEATTVKTEFTWTQKFSLMIGACAYLGHRKRPGWREHLPFYAFKCPTHGIVEDYPHGYNNRLDCPKCAYERQAPRR